jgi:hypothetical protein
MSILCVVFALAMLAFAAILQRYITRGWRQCYFYPNQGQLPHMCPTCLSSNATAPVDEESSEWQTAYYVIASKVANWKVRVPYCSVCKRKLDNANLIGVASGAVCVVAALLLLPPTEPSLIVFCYILFGTPAYTFVTTLQKGIVFGRANGNVILIRIRHREYYDALMHAPITLGTAA